MAAKVVSKLVRLQLSGDIRDFLQKLPFSGLKESQVGNHVYWAEGRLKVGARPKKVRVRIWIEDERVSLSVKSEEMGLDVTVPFGAPKEKKVAPATVKRAILASMN